jgi:hypothetical protein
VNKIQCSSRSIALLFFGVYTQQTHLDEIVEMIESLGLGDVCAQSFSFKTTIAKQIIKESVEWVNSSEFLASQELVKKAFKRERQRGNLFACVDGWANYWAMLQGEYCWVTLKEIAIEDLSQQASYLGTLFKLQQVECFHD